MTRVNLHDFGDTTPEDVSSLATDVNVISKRFPGYKIGMNEEILGEKDSPEVPSMKDIVAKETALLIEQQKRLSVRDIASKFEKGLAAAAKLSEEAKFKDAVLLDRHVLLKRLRDLLESLQGRVAGRNKDDVEEAISMVEALAAQLTHRDGELIQEKAEMKRLAIFLKQASEDAKRAVEEERAFARAEIENARTVVRRVELAYQQLEQKLKNDEKQDLEELMKDVQEARRIKMLHQPSKVMDMEYELQALRVQLAEKSLHSIQLQKELAVMKKFVDNKRTLYELEGIESLGSSLRVIRSTDDSPDISKCTIQWFRISLEGSQRQEISGATKSVYAPEPYDVGRLLQAEIMSNDDKFTVTTSSLIDPAAGLANYVEGLVKKPVSEFSVFVTVMNGREVSSDSEHIFHVEKMRIKLCKGKITKAKESYSSSMQLCGVRGGGNAVAKALYWQPKRGTSFTLVFESERERNSAIMLARRFAFDYNIVLGGPGDRVPVRA